MSARSGRPSFTHGARALDFIRHLPQFVRLYWRLLCDARVSIWPKALLILGLVYVVSPLDFMPDVIPVVGQVDDLVVLIVLSRLFIYLCPPEVVAEHVRRLGAESG